MKQLPNNLQKLELDLSYNNLGKYIQEIINVSDIIKNLPKNLNILEMDLSLNNLM